MRGAVLIFGGNRNARVQKAGKLIVEAVSIDIAKKHPDLLEIKTLEKKRSIGIDQTREISRFLTKKPLEAKKKVVIVHTAEKLTIPAQNALLKTLEEPPEFALIILEAKTEDSLLPTVVSRCQKIRATTGAKTVTAEKLKSILELLPGERLARAEKMSKEERETVIEMLEEWIEEGRGLLRKNPTETKQQNLKVILRVKKDLEETNLGLRLALEHLALKLRKG